MPNDNTDPNNASNPDDAGKQSEGKGGEGAGNQNPPNAGTQPKTFTQDQVNSFIAEEKRKWKDQQQADEAKRKGEFEQLYNAEKSTKEALESQLAAVNADLEKYKGAITDTNKAALEKLPEKIRALAPADADPITLAKWLPSAQALASEQTQNPPPGNPQNPKGKGGQSAEDVQKTKTELRKSGGYGL